MPESEKTGLTGQNMYLCIQFSFHMKKLIKKVALLSFTMVFWVATYAQCAMCKGQLETTNDTGVGLAVNDGILYLLSLPFIIGASVAFMIWNIKRKQKRQLAES